ncbi:MAG: hypothetical protein ABFQ89_06155 [Chloroflexota bacterium]
MSYYRFDNQGSDSQGKFSFIGLIDALLLVVLMWAIVFLTAILLFPSDLQVLLTDLIKPSSDVNTLSDITLESVDVVPTNESSTKTHQPVASVTPTMTNATETLMPTASVALMNPTPTVSPVSIPAAVFSYTIDPYGPTFTSNFANAAGCNWLGIAGDVLEPKAKGLSPLTVNVAAGDSLSTTIAGDNRVYGNNGWEIPLDSKPKVMTLQIYLQYNDEAVSDVYTFTTRADCTQNLILIDFQWAE